MSTAWSVVWTDWRRNEVTRSTSASTTGRSSSAYAVADWCPFNGTNTFCIDPGSPWQNAWIESFNGRLRDEHVNGQQFACLLEARVLTEAWRIDYNISRPVSAHSWRDVEGRLDAVKTARY